MNIVQSYWHITPSVTSVICSQCKLSTEDIAYAPGQSLRVIVKPRNTEWTSFCSSLCAQQSEAFHLVDLGQLLQSHRLWKENLPHIKPYYGEDMLLVSLCCVGSLDSSKSTPVCLMTVNPGYILQLYNTDTLASYCHFVMHGLYAKYSKHTCT